MILYHFRKEIEDLINNSGLSIDVAYFVIKDIFNEVADLYEQQIKIENAAIEVEKSQNEIQDDTELAAATKEQDKIDKE